MLFEIKPELTKENVEKELKKKGYNDYDLAAYYIPNFKNFNYPVKSDLREDDHNNSLIARMQGGKLQISDFGYKTGMSIYGYLLEKYHNGITDHFPKVLDRIRSDFRLDLTKYNYLDIFKPKFKKPKKYGKSFSNTSLPVKIEVKRQRVDGKIYWSKEDINYWNSFGISITKLNEKKIAPLDYFWITNYNKNGIRKTYNVRKQLCYVYPFYRNKNGFFMYKIYLPNGLNGNKDIRWISNVNKKVIQNIENIPTSGDLLIIQSSYKDIMLLEELDSNIYSIAPNGEGYFFEDNEWFNLRKSWKKIIYFANNDSHKKDNPGLKFARRYTEKYRIPFVSTPDNTTSDITDYYKKYGIEETKRFLNYTMSIINLLV